VLEDCDAPCQAVFVCPSCAAFSFVVSRHGCGLRVAALRLRGVSSMSAGCLLLVGVGVLLGGVERVRLDEDALEDPVSS
jgi:hypothetical protein